MRFKVKLSPYDQASEVKISVDYRRRFISFLKRVFEKDFKEISPKPYTFAVYFGKNTKFNKDFIKVTGSIIFRFSTGDEKVAISFYNGVLRLKKEEYLHDFSPIKQDNALFKIERITLEKEALLSDSFKTLSPIVIERKTTSKLPKNRYATPFDEDFNEWLVENTLRRMAAVLKQPIIFREFYLEPIAVKEELVKHYGGYVRCFLGTFKHHTDNPALLKFIYQYGLGFRTGQGFGYLEVAE